MIDFADIGGQDYLKRGFEVAAAGGHHLLLLGELEGEIADLARSIQSILPTLSREETDSLIEIYTSSVILSTERPPFPQPPFCSPDSNISPLGFIGGGSELRPGEVSLAHRGALYLHDLDKFNPRVFAVLPGIVESKRVVLGRSMRESIYPADFLLVSSIGEVQGIDLEGNIAYLGHRVPDSILDLFEIEIAVYTHVGDNQPVRESSSAVRRRVENAREIQRQRFARKSFKTNAEMGMSEVREFCKLDKASQAVLSMSIRQQNLSAKALQRTLKVARTIADLACQQKLGVDAVSEALQYTREGIGRGRPPARCHRL